MSDRPTHLRCDHLPDPIGLTEARPRLSWHLPPKVGKQTAYEVSARDVTSGRIESGESHLVDWPFEPLGSRRRVEWRVRAWGEGGATDWSEPAVVEAGLMERRDWRARFISGHLSGGPRSGVPTTRLRRTFHLDGPPEAARLYITALGLYVASVNGQRVGDAHLAPGWTDFRQRVQVQTYDLTDLLRPGANVIGVEIADGWYCGHLSWNHRQQYGEQPHLLAQLEVGGKVVAATDDAWQASQDGPTLRADLLMGEHVDARRTQAGWDEPGDFDDAGWRPARVATGEAFEQIDLLASASPPVRDQEIFTPPPAVDIGRHYSASRWAYDLGQNMVGVARLDFAALREHLPEGAEDMPAGLTLRLRFAEMLNADGTLYRENLRTAEATDYYTCRGDEVRSGTVWQPQFTFHGFRYVELVGLPALRDDAPPPGALVKGVVLHDDFEPTGAFACSDERINRLQHCIRWGQKGNFLSVPTDCPQRDERLGWTGDIQVFAPTASFNADVAGFLSKWLLDLRDAQGPSGGVPNVCPSVPMPSPSSWNEPENPKVVDGGPAWSDAAVIVPEVLWQRYGDKRLIERSYDSMRRYVDRLRNEESTGLIRRHTLHTGWCGFGDWLSLDGAGPGSDGGTLKDLIGTAYFARCCHLLSEMAGVLGHGEDANAYKTLEADVAAAFTNEFATPAGRLASHTQTAYLLALSFDLLPDDRRPAALEYLLDLLDRRGWKLATGFVGTPLILPTLTRFGHLDKAYRVLLSDSYPGWLFTVSLGATTMWERWNSWTPTEGFGPVSMNSFNHYAYGAVGQWLYETAGGLLPVEPAYRRSRIAPQPGRPETGEGLTSANARLLTPYGQLASDWRIEDGQFRLQATVPPNTTADVQLPSTEPRTLGPGVHDLSCAWPTE